MTPSTSNWRPTRWDLFDWKDPEVLSIFLVQSLPGAWFFLGHWTVSMLLMVFWYETALLFLIALVRILLDPKSWKLGSLGMILFGIVMAAGLMLMSGGFFLAFGPDMLLQERKAGVLAEFRTYLASPTYLLQLSLGTVHLLWKEGFRRKKGTPGDAVQGGGADIGAEAFRRAIWLMMTVFVGIGLVMILIILMGQFGIFGRPVLSTAMDLIFFAAIALKIWFDLHLYLTWEKHLEGDRAEA